MKIMTVSLTFLILLTLANGCSDRKNTTGKDGIQVEKMVQPQPGKSRIKNPAGNQQIRTGETVKITLEFMSDSPGIDSVIFFTGDKKAGSSDRDPFVYDWKVEGVKAGENIIRTLIYYQNGATATNQVTVIVLPDKKPVILKYKVVNVYPHDIHAYTQGLIYEDGFLYEGTGQYNESSLRKVNIKSGEPVRILNLPGDLFGEGITIFGNKIFQLTYKSQVGFVYEKESFERIQKVYYENKEGWGLTHNGSQLIMSDGTNLIYFMDPEYFTETGRIGIYDDKGPVTLLNELEYIDGKIYANIYGRNEIVIIDPESGIVTAKIDFKDLLAEKDRHNRIDVFNGIAYNKDNQTLIVTGKYWPKLFEVRLSESP